MNMFDVVESDLREQIILLKSDNEVLKSEIVRLEQEKKDLEQTVNELKDYIKWADDTITGLTEANEEYRADLANVCLGCKSLIGNELLRLSVDVRNGKDDD